MRVPPVRVTLLRLARCWGAQCLCFATVMQDLSART